MRKASPQNKEVEDLVESKVRNPHPTRFKGVDDRADCIKGATHNQQDKSLNGNILIDRRHKEDGEPAHQNIKTGIEPAGGVQKEYPEEDTCYGQDPHHGQQDQSHGTRKRQETNGCIGACDQNKNHGMIDFS